VARGHGARERAASGAASRAEMLARPVDNIGHARGGPDSTPTAARPAATAVAERLYGGDVQIGKEHEPVGGRFCDEHASRPQGDGIRVTNLVRVAAGQVKAERLKWVASQQLTNFVGAHIRMLALGWPTVNERFACGDHQPRTGGGGSIAPVVLCESA
jgi:hypothetical protein